MPENPEVQPNPMRRLRMADGETLIARDSEVTQILMEASIDRIAALEGERDRARRLAARLEEVVAARTAVLQALDHWLDEPEEHDYLEIAQWARAQLEEVP